MELINTYCHSRYCGHGEGEVEEYVRAAEAAGITTLAFTEHFPLTPAFDPDKYLSVMPENLPRYLEAVEQARRDHPALEIITGCEMDYLGPDEDRTITEAEYADACALFGELGLGGFFQQDESISESFIPAFDGTGLEDT